MAASTSKKFVVTEADGNKVEVEATRVDDEHGVVRLFNGDDLVARFTNAQSVRPA